MRIRVLETAPEAVGVEELDVGEATLGERSEADIGDLVKEMEVAERSLFKSSWRSATCCV